MGSGFARCLLEEKDPQVRTHMLQYQSNIMQDALELNWTTAKRAQTAVLTEMERGHNSWADQSGVDMLSTNSRSGTSRDCPCTNSRS